MLLDTHYVYALADNPSWLTAAERRLIDAPPSPLMVSVVSLWEIRIKWNARHPSGDRKSRLSPAAAWGLIQALRLPILDLTPAEACLDLAAPLGPGDLFDELLLAQAQARALKLFTRDRRLAGHPLVITI